MYHEKECVPQWQLIDFQSIHKNQRNYMSYKVYKKFSCFCLAGAFQSPPPVPFIKLKQNHLEWKKIFDRPLKLTL